MNCTKCIHQHIVNHSGLLTFTRGYAKHPCTHLSHSQGGLSVGRVERYRRAHTRA